MVSPEPATPQDEGVRYVLSMEARIIRNSATAHYLRQIR
jgi:hypothetical protein